MSQKGLFKYKYFVIGTKRLNITEKSLGILFLLIFFLDHCAVIYVWEEKACKTYINKPT